MLNFIDGHPNRLEPGKRPRTTLINYIVSKGRYAGNDGWLPGRRPSGAGKCAANAEHPGVRHENAQEAVEAPRFATESVPDSFYPHVYYPNRVSLEQGYPAQNWDTLRALGHGEFVQAATCGMGATIAHRDPQTGVLSAGGDPRRACYALGW